MKARGAPMLARHRDTWRALAASVVPELAHADAAAWDEIEATVAHALSARPARLRRQLSLLFRLIALMSRVRFRRPLRDVDPARRERFLLALQHAPLPLLRRGIWGIRTLVFLGHYTRPEVVRALGYRADPLGWSAGRPADGGDPIMRAR